jgi:hypothetical protein
LSAQDVVEKDFWNNVHELNNNMERNFNESNRHEYTKQMVDKIRLGREMRQAIDPAGEEYGNYKKFDGSNSVTQKDDPGVNDLGYDQYEKNLRSLMEEMDMG